MLPAVRDSGALQGPHCHPGFRPYEAKEAWLLRGGVSGSFGPLPGSDRRRSHTQAGGDRLRGKIPVKKNTSLHVKKLSNV